MRYNACLDSLQEKNTNTEQDIYEILCSYCFRVVLYDSTTTGVMTCFSNEANSLVKDCKELLQTVPASDPYEYPPELLSLQGKRKIFQLHFDPDSTKDNQIFILDTCWDDTPLPPSDLATVTESAAGSSMEKTLQPMDPATKRKTGKSALAEASTPTLKKHNAPDTFDTNEPDTTPPPKATPLAETTKPKNQQPKRSTRRSLFTESKDSQEATSHKKKNM